MPSFYGLILNTWTRSGFVLSFQWSSLVCVRRVRPGDKIKWKWRMFFCDWVELNRENFHYGQRIKSRKTYHCFEDFYSYEVAQIRLSTQTRAIEFSLQKVWAFFFWQNIFWGNFQAPQKQRFSCGVLLSSISFLRLFWVTFCPFCIKLSLTF